MVDDASRLTSNLTECPQASESLKRYMNESTAPIGSLPNDVLLQVFEECKKLAMGTLISVCYLWRALISSQPLFWTYVELAATSNSTQDAALQTMLSFFFRTSAHFPLDIRIYAGGRSLVHEPSISTLVAHTDRWKTLTIDNGDILLDQFSDIIPKGDLPNLEYVDFGVTSLRLRHISWFEAAPRLRTIHSDAFAFPALLMNYPSVTDFSVIWTKDAFLQLHDYSKRIAAGLQQVTFLELGWDLFAAVPNPLVFEHLQTLIFQSLKTGDSDTRLHLLFGSMTLPALHTFVIQAGQTNGPWISSGGWDQQKFIQLHMRSWFPLRSFVLKAVRVTEREMVEVMSFLDQLESFVWWDRVTSPPYSMGEEFVKALMNRRRDEKDDALPSLPCLRYLELVGSVGFDPASLLTTLEFRANSGDSRLTEVFVGTSPHLETSWDRVKSLNTKGMAITFQEMSFVDETSRPTSSVADD